MGVAHLVAPFLASSLVNPYSVISRTSIFAQQYSTINKCANFITDFLFSNILSGLNSHTFRRNYANLRNANLRNLKECITFAPKQETML